LAELRKTVSDAWIRLENVIFSKTLLFLSSEVQILLTFLGSTFKKEKTVNRRRVSLPQQQITQIFTLAVLQRQHEHNMNTNSRKKHTSERKNPADD